MPDAEREVKRLISYIRSCREAGIDCTVTIDKTLTHGVLNALEEIQRYRKIGTVKECQDAMERPKPKELEKILDKIEEAARLENAPIYCGNMVVGQ